MQLTLDLDARTSFTEACFWTIEADTEAWKDTSEIYIWLEPTFNSLVKVYQGTGRNNASEAVEAN